MWRPLVFVVFPPCLTWQIFISCLLYEGKFAVLIANTWHNELWNALGSDIQMLNLISDLDGNKTGNKNSSGVKVMWIKKAV